MAAKKDLERNKFDEYGGVSMVDWIHHQNHLGKAFSHSETNTLASAATKEFLITTPAGEEHVHFNLAGIMRSEAAAEIYIFEVPTVTDPGTAVAMVNRNRNKASITPGAVVTEDPTTSADGLQVFYDRIGAGQVVGGVSADRQELELLSDTQYLVRFKSLAAGNDTTSRIDFYEAKHVE